MPFKMGLFNKKIIRIVLLSGLLFLITGVALYFIIRINHWNKIQKGQASSAIIEKLISRSDSSMGFAPTLAEQYAQSALKIALKENQAHYIIQCWMILGEIENIKGENTKAQKLFTKAYQLAQQKSLLQELCLAKIKIGEIIYDHGEYETALTYFEEAEKLSEAHHLEQPKSYALYYIGKYNETKGHFQKAREYYDQAIIISRKIKITGNWHSCCPAGVKIISAKANFTWPCYVTWKLFK